MAQLSTFQVPFALANFALAYENANFIADDLMTVQPVQKRIGNYFVYGKELFTPEVDIRAPKSPANEIEHEYSSATYSCVEHALKEYVSWEERNDAKAFGTPLDPYRDAAQLVAMKVNLRRELDVANLLRTTGNYASGNTAALAGGANFDLANQGTVDPLAVLEGYMDTVRSKIGVLPNTAVIPRAVWRVLRQHAKLQAIIPTTQERIVSPNDLAGYLEMDPGSIYVPMPLQNTANVGQTPVLSDIWGKDIILMYRSPTPRLKQITFAKIFRLQYNNGSKKAQPMQARTWEDVEREADAVQVAVTEDKRVIAPDAGFLVQNAVS